MQFNLEQFSSRDLKTREDFIALEYGQVVLVTIRHREMFEDNYKHCFKNFASNRKDYISTDYAGTMTIFNEVQFDEPRNRLDCEMIIFDLVHFAAQFAPGESCDPFVSGREEAFDICHTMQEVLDMIEDDYARFQLLTIA